MSTESPANAEMHVDSWDDVRNRIVNKYDLINNRTNWMLTSQTIFFGIYSILITNKVSTDDYSNILYLILLVSLITGILIYLSVWAAIITIRKTVNKHKDNSLIGFEGMHWIALGTPILLPLTFLIAR